ncbi:MAG: alpha/beta hydrolase [Humibacillus sp.]|nr:alpha/beta hydrolase [Humibacillus sp.]MDN5776064.1 alpha/beta hydrolase [Humibacillus sp.]
MRSKRRDDDRQRDQESSGTPRRTMLAAGAGIAVGAATLGAAGSASAVSPNPAENLTGARSREPGTRISVAPGVSVNISDQDGGRRGTVVFVPGWPLASTTFEYTYQFLADHGYRAIGIDQRGFGLSDAPYGPYGYDVWARDIQTVLRTLSLRNVTLVGHSMGGAVALRHAAKFGNRIGKLVVAEVPAPRFVYGPESADLTAALNGLIAGYATDRAATVRSFSGNFFATHTDITTDPFLQFFERQCLDQASLPASRAGLIALRDTDLTSDLGKVSVKTLVFHAINDKIVPLDHGQAVAAGIRRARLVTFATAGHAIYVDEPEKFNRELLDFIR